MAIEARTTSHQGPGEDGAASVESVGISIGVLALVVGMAAGLSGPGLELGRTVARSLEAVIADARRDGGPARGPAASRPGGEGAAPTAQVTRPDAVAEPLAAATTVLRREEHVEEEVVVSRGEAPPRPDDLRMRPLTPQVALRREEWQRRLTSPDAQASIEAQACLVCAGAAGRHSFALGGQAVGGRGGRDAEAAAAERGLAIHAMLDAQASLAAAEVTASAARAVGPARLRTQGRAAVALGASTSLAASALLSEQEQRVHLEAGAVAGAHARAEHRISVRAGGIALQHTAGAEGWAGVGGRARLRLGRRSGSRFEYDVAVGAALGLGGELDFAGTVDVSALARTKPPPAGLAFLPTTSPVGIATRAAALVVALRKG